MPATILAISFNQPLTAVGGTGPYTWSVDDGSLPAGLTLDAATGVISGTPTTLGVWYFRVRVTDAFGAFGIRNYNGEVTATTPTPTATVTPTPTPSPSKSPTPTPTGTQPTPTPAGCVKTLDCKTQAGGFTYEQWGFACWYHKPLPNSLKAKIGPVSIPTNCGGCTAACYGFPTVQTDITLTRPTECDWDSGVIVWYNSNYQTGLTLFVTPWQDIFQQNPSINPINSVFQFSGAGMTGVGSCSYDPVTGKTTGQISGTAIFEPQGCSCVDNCELPFIVYFDESL